MNYNNPKENPYLDEDNAHPLNKLNANNIYEGDCLDFMKMLPDKYVDLILTDPPYGINVMNQKRCLARGTNKWHSVGYGDTDWDKQIPSEEYFKEMVRVSKNQIVFGGNYFIEYLSNSPCWIVWDKDNGDNDFADCELAWTSFKTAVRKIVYPYATVKYWNKLEFEKRQHPTQKPVPVFRWILEKYSKENDLVFDPFMGSGTTAIACKQTKRRWLGCEINQDYIKIINKRLQQTILNDDGGTNFTKSSADDFPTESLISVKRESADSPNSPHIDNTNKEEANFS